MASNTENLNLLMKNPSTDGADTFNIQTMLNENWQKIDNNAGTVAQTLANILKPTTPPIIGLPSSTTPDGMFQALGNTGELHVWRKTVVTTEPIPEQPAGYNLGSKTNFLIGTPSRSSREPYINVMYANTVSVSNDGTVNISGDSSSISGWYPSNGDSPNYLQMRGKFIKITQFVYLDAPRTVDMDTVYYIPNDATATLPNYGSASGEFRIEMQKVIGYPYTPAIPAGTTTTYPVSTNPNAYQEGSDAKPAGYTLGEVVTSKVKLGYSRLSSGMFYYYADTLSVSDDGKVSISTQNSYQVNRNSNMSNLKTAMAGKFIQLYGSSGSAIELSGPFSTIPGEIVFIPADTSFNTETIRGDDYFTIDRYQPVTGYAAIPAGTTIEYLGKLGDKARVQVVSYVGTGTYGSGHPNSLTFDFAPKLVIIRANGAAHVFIYTLLFLAGTLTKTFQENGYVNLIGDNEPGLSDAYARVSGRTLAWYSVDSYNRQANYKGAKYTAIAIG